MRLRQKTKHSVATWVRLKGRLKQSCECDRDGGVITMLPTIKMNESFFLRKSLPAEPGHQREDVSTNSCRKWLSSAFYLGRAAASSHSPLKSVCFPTSHDEQSSFSSASQSVSQSVSQSFSPSVVQELDSLSLSILLLSSCPFTKFTDGRARGRTDGLVKEGRAFPRPTDVGTTRSRRVARPVRPPQPIRGMQIGRAGWFCRRREGRQAR